MKIKLLVRKWYIIASNYCVIFNSLDGSEKELIKVYDKIKRGSYSKWWAIIRRRYWGRGWNRRRGK